MTTTYTLTVNNKSSGENAFILFTEPPRVDGGDNPTIYTNVFQRSDVADNQNGQAVFEIDRTVMAICLTSKASLAAGTRVRTSDSEQVSIGTYEKAASVVEVDYNPETSSGKLGAVTLATEKNAPAGGFVLKTKGGWTAPTNNNFSIGVGAKDSGKTVPLAIFPAKPNKTYNIFPVTKFYVAVAGSFQPGEIIDIKTIGTYYPVQFKDGNISIILDFASDEDFHLAS